jgi:hypothetical protein
MIDTSTTPLALITSAVMAQHGHVCSAATLPSPQTTVPHHADIIDHKNTIIDGLSFHIYSHLL